jgi:hypothetical protein
MTLGRLVSPALSPVREKTLTKGRAAIVSILTKAIVIVIVFIARLDESDVRFDF